MSKQIVEYNKECLQSIWQEMEIKEKMLDCFDRYIHALLYEWNKQHPNDLVHLV